VASASAHWSGYSLAQTVARDRSPDDAKASVSLSEWPKSDWCWICRKPRWRECVRSSRDGDGRSEQLFSTR
jgi:hypothetical protein